MSASVQIPAWNIMYGGTQVAGNLLTHSQHVHYDEAIGGKANVLEIQVEDSARAWANNPPVIGTALSLSIGYQGQSLVSCGNFEVDEWEAEGPPDTFLIRAIQAGVTHAIRTSYSQPYEGQTLTSIAKTIAAKYGMSVSIDAVNPDVPYQHITQRLESDLAFLHRLANGQNYEFTIRGDQLVFYSRPKLDAKTISSLTDKNAQYIYKTDSTRFRIHQQHHGDKTYKKAVVMYFDPLSKKLLQATANAAATATQGVDLGLQDTLLVRERIENAQQATLRAQAHLHAANMHVLKGEIIIPGSMVYRAGNPVMLSGFGTALDSIKWIINEGKHRLDRNGYKTSLELRTTITGAATQFASDDYGE
jgi:phage protein D